MFNNPVTLMAIMMCLFMAFIIVRSLIVGYRKKISFARLALVAVIGAFFIGTIFMFYIR